MSKSFMECSEAIANAVRLCKPGVIASYPITPQTHIVEKLADFVADGMDTEFIDVESEHSAMSACIGAEATGVRTFTATCSQGMALMSEMLFVASGMRLPIVLANANRALSSPINIWNDHSDTMAQRDSGWLQFHCENSQEAFDTIIQAYKIAENAKVNLPAMVCVDGFVLSHLWETLELLSQEQVDAFLPSYTPKFRLDAAAPATLGALAFPNSYMEFKKQQDDAMQNALEVSKEVMMDFGKEFGRKYGLIEEYNMENAKYAIVCLGSVAGTIKAVINDSAKKIGLVRIRSFRPFPLAEIKKALNGIKAVAVIEKSASPGSTPPLYTEMRAALKDCDTKINDFVVGLGGREVDEARIKKIISRIGQAKEVDWIF